MTIKYNVKGIKPIKPPSPKKSDSRLSQVGFFFAKIIFIIYIDIYICKSYHKGSLIGTSPSGKAPGFGPGIPEVRILPSQFVLVITIPAHKEFFFNAGVYYQNFINAIF